ncbi:MAG: B12-binding domain-containing radical SAM protein, partial [Anaerolineales bacterium]
MNALLIYPQFPDTFWSFKHAIKFIGKKAVSPPLGLLTIASMLPKDWNLRLVDLNVRQLSKADLQWADIALISAMTAQRKSVYKVVASLKEQKIPIVAGGPLFVYEYDDFPEIDYFVLNEGELTLPKFLSDFAQGHTQRLYATSEYADLSTTPAPRWDLINFNDYVTLNIQFSRGCPFNCDFCNVTALLGHRPRTKPPQNIIAELDSMYQFGWRGSVFFVDDNFIGNKKILKNELLPALIEWQKDKKGISFSTEASINLADDVELMQMLVAAGFTSVFIGVETPDEDSLANCNKKQNLERNLVEDIKRIQHHGLQVQGGFIVGFDNDLPSIFQRQIEFIQKSGIVTAMVGILQAPPGTGLYERLKKEGRILAHISGDNVDGTTNILPKMGLDPLVEGYRKILQTLYQPKNYYQRVITFLQEYHPPKLKVHLDFSSTLMYLRAFLRSIFQLGVIGKERAEYWRLFFWTLFRRPRLFPYSITLAIYGYHFRKICERVLEQ